MSQYSSIASPTENARVEVSKDGVTWMFIPGSGSVTESGGEAPTREQVTFQDVKQITGKARPPTVEISLTGYGAALAPAFDAIREARAANTILQWRATFAEYVIIQPASGAGTQTVAIASSGAVTFAAGVNGVAPDLTDERVGIGSAIRIHKTGGDELYIIGAISDTGVATVIPAPASQVAAAMNFSIVTPSMRRGPFPATVSAFDNISADSESQLTTTLTLAPLSVLPALVPVV